MVAPAAWKNYLALAKQGNADATNRVVSLLLQWTYAQMPPSLSLDEEGLALRFVERMFRDQFAFLPDQPWRLEAYLRKSWRHSVINWLAEEQRRRKQEITWADWARMEDEEDEDPTPDDLAAPDPGPEQIVLLRAEIEELRAEVTHLTPLDQQIFALLFDEERSEPEIAQQLGKSAGAVRWHVHAIREHLRAWRQARQG